VVAGPSRPAEDAPKAEAREQFLAAAKRVADMPLSPEAILKKKFEGEATVEFTAAKSAQLFEGLSLKPGERASLYLAPKVAGKTGSRVYVIVNWTVATRLRQFGIDDPAGHFRDRLIRVSGTVKELAGGNIPGERSLYTTDGGFKSETITSGKEPEYYLVVESLDQIKLVRKP
jgi:hypothetical protein